MRLTHVRRRTGNARGVDVEKKDTKRGNQKGCSFSSVRLFLLTF